MIPSKKRFYLLTGFLCLAGYAWLLVNITNNHVIAVDPASVCIVKHATTLPCPSCGSTTSAMLFFSGNFPAALHTNPLGILLAVAMCITPFWVLYDLLTGKETLLACFHKSEALLKKKWIAIPGIVLITINWAWNFLKM